ncbi:MAG: LysE family transporter [Prevotella sp.]|nr:LysE family transporter [Prevotella sp.]
MLPFQIHIGILNWVFKGLLIGIIASAPMGPVGVLCVQRTLNKGRWYGFVTGIGAAISDFLYALITGFGMSFVVNLIDNHQNRFILQMIGSVMLLIFGIYSYRSDPTKKIRATSKNKGTLVHNGVTAFLVTFSNPLIIFLFMACFAQFTFVTTNLLFTGIGFCCIIIGALLWWYGLTWLIDKVRNKFDSSGIILINKIIGSIVITFSLIIFIVTVFNYYAFYI